MSESYANMWQPIMPEAENVCTPMPKPLPGRDLCLRRAVEISIAQEFRGPRSIEDIYDAVLASPSDEDQHVLGVFNASSNGGLRYDKETGVYSNIMSCLVEGCSMSCKVSLHSPLSDAERPHEIEDSSSLDECIQ